VEHQQEVSDFDRVVADIQKQVEEQERTLFSAKVIEQARYPVNVGRMDDPDGHAILWGSCGDMMEIYLRLNGSGKTIEKATFVTNGCGPSVACGNMIATMAQEKTLEAATQIEPEDLIAALDGLPPEHVHCAYLAVDTLREAIAHRRMMDETDEV